MAYQTSLCTAQESAMQTCDAGWTCKVLCVHDLMMGDPNSFTSLVHPSCCKRLKEHDLPLGTLLCITVHGC